MPVAQGTATSADAERWTREQVRAFLQRAMDVGGYRSFNELAKHARISHTTLTRFLNNPDTGSVPTTVTLAKIALAARLPFLGNMHATAVATEEARIARIEEAVRLLSELVVLLARVPTDALEEYARIERRLQMLFGPGSDAS